MYPYSDCLNNFHVFESYKIIVLEFKKEKRLKKEMTHPLTENEFIKQKNCPWVDFTYIRAVTHETFLLDIL